MADKSLRYVVSAIDKGAGKTIGDVATHGSKAASTIGGAFGKMSGVLGGEVGELASKLQEHFDQLGEHGGHGLAAKLEVGGAAMLGVGTALTAMGAAEKQATDQLETAVTNTGGSFEELEGKVEGAVGHMEKYGFTAIQTKNALTSLTNATHDPEQALGLMGEAADLAASRHMTLNAAADMLAKTVNGSTRLYKLYGIQVKTNADGTKDLTGAQEQLARLLHGQADSAANNFTGRLKQLRAEVEDNVAAFGEKYGPAIMAAGGAVTLLTPVLKGAGSALSGLAGKFKASGAAATASAEETAAADAQIVESNEAAAASGGRLRGGAMGAAAGLGVAATAVGALIVGGYELSKAIDGANWERYQKAIHAGDQSLRELLTDVVNGKGTFEGLSDSWARNEVTADGLATKAAAAGITVDQLATAVTGGAKATTELIAQWEKSGAPADATIGMLITLEKKYQSTRTAAEKAAESTKHEAEAQNPLAAKLGLTNSALKTAEQAARKTAASNRANTLQMQLENNAAGLLSSSLDKLNGRTLNVEQANIAFRNSEHSLSEAVKTNGKSLSDNTQKGRDNRSAILDSISAAQQHAEAVAKQTGSTKAATAAYQGDIEALRRHLEKLGLEPAAIQRIIDKYGRVPSLKTTKLTVKDLASEKLSQIQSYLHGLALGVTIPVRVQKSGISNEATSGGKAGGTDFFAGGRTLIAEREPELVDLPRGSTITPLSKLPRAHYEKPVTAMDWTPMLTVLHDIRRAILSERNLSIDGYALETAMGRRADRYGRTG